MHFQQHVLISLLCISLVRVGVAEVRTTQLHFNSFNCDESPRRVTEEKSYELIWMGKADPPLCSFNFTAGEDPESYLQYKLCFQSKEFELTTYGISVHVTDKTKTWKFNNYDSAMEKTCKEKVEDLGIWLQLEKDYQYDKETALLVKITAEKLVIVVEEDSIWDTVKRTFQQMLPLIIVSIVVIAICGNKTGPARSLEIFRALSNCICDICGICKEQREGTTDGQTSARLEAEGVNLTIERTDSPSETVDGTLPPPYPENAMPYPSSIDEEAPPPSYDEITGPEKKDMVANS